MVTPRRRKPRAPRGRGLRSTAGCLTCRQRRLKCDEQRPICSNCAKSARDCWYSTTEGASDEQNGSGSVADNDGSPSPVSSPEHGTGPDIATPQNDERPDSQGLSQEALELNSTQFVNVEDSLRAEPIDLARSPSTTASFAPGIAPFQWYELIARDAWQNPDSYRFLTSHGSRWSFNSQEVSSIVQHQAVSPHVLDSSSAQPTNLARLMPGGTDIASKLRPWNTSKPMALSQREADYLEHYVTVVGPLLDLFDPQLRFTTDLLRLALRNEGLLKSILALSASHRASYADETLRVLSVDSLLAGNQSPSGKSDREMAVQYYYETLGYLSQSMRVPGYADSQEILANAALISWYEAFESDSSQNWERHLKGVFWIQRSRNSDGESSGLPGAVWWTWLRQDIWAAFRNSRKTLTIWIPTKSLNVLSAEELACRVLYLQAKAVSYAAKESHETSDFEQRMLEGDELLTILEEWRQLLPVQFDPLPLSVATEPPSIYKPLWIHPPMYAAAMQAYNSAKLLALLNKPSRGGRQEFHALQKLLDACVESICGVAAAPNATYPPLAMVNSQALFVGKYLKQIVAESY